MHLSAHYEQDEDESANFYVDAQGCDNIFFFQTYFLHRIMNQCNISPVNICHHNLSVTWARQIESEAGVREGVRQV